MKSIYPELSPYGGKMECARTDNAFFPISEVCKSNMFCPDAADDDKVLFGLVLAFQQRLI